MVSQTRDGRLRFRVYLPHAGSVELAGSFTSWRLAPIPMERESGPGGAPTGWWEVCISLPAGEQEFCYIVDSCIWLADYAAHGVSLCGMTGWVSRVVVAA